MILKYFRTNQSAILLSLPLVGGLFWALHFFDSSPSFISRGFLLEKLTQELVFQPILIKSIALTLICLQSFMLNQLINGSEVFSKITHIPLLIFILLGSMLSHRGGLEPMTFANIFLLLAMTNALKVYHQNSAIGLTFNIGFWIGMAALFEPACLLLLVPALASVLILRAADWRELFFLLVGSAFPLAFLWVICFVSDTTFSFSENYFQRMMNYLPYGNSPLFNFFLVLLAFIFLGSLYFYLRSLRGVIIRTRKMRMALLYFSISLVIIYIWLYFTPFSPPQNQILLIPGVILLSFLLIHTNRPVWIDTFLYIIIGIWMIFVYNLYLG